MLGHYVTYFSWAPLKTEPRQHLPESGHFVTWDFPKIRGYPYFGVLIIRILLFRVLYEGPQFSQIAYKDSKQWELWHIPYYE